MADEFKIQLSFRGPKDTLYNVRGDDVEETEAILARLRESDDPAIQLMMEAADDGRAPKPKPKPKAATAKRAVVKSVPPPKDDEEDEEDETEEDEEEDEDEEEESEDEDAPTPNQIRAAKRLGITGYSKLTSKELEEKLTESFKRR